MTSIFPSRFLAVYLNMRLLPILVLIAVVFPAFSQDTLRVSANLGSVRSRLDSITSMATISRGLDSLMINAWSDSLRKKVSHRFSPDFLTRYGDSLRNFRVPEREIGRRVDSLMRRKASLLEEVNGKQGALHQKINGRYARWQENLRKKFNLDSAGVRLPNSTLSATKFKTPSANLPSAPDVQMPDIPAMPSLESSDFSSLGVSPELSSIGGSMTMPSAPQLGELHKATGIASLDELGMLRQGIPEPMGEVNKQVAEVKELAVNPSDAAEKNVLKVGEVSDATKQLSEAEKMKEQAEALKTAEQLKDPEAMKEQAVNHFASKEAELQGAMSQLTKYKKKHSSIGSFSEIPKETWLPKNGLKGKPFKERFRPGMNLGVRSNRDTILIDLYPNAAYRITGRIEAGLGGIYRLRVSSNPFGFDQKYPVWGLSLFTVVKTFKGVFVRLETDATSHMKYGSSEAPTYRDWRWSFHTGIQTNFRISKRVKGNVQMLYSFDSNLKDGFPERLTARIGVQYSLKKTKAKELQGSR